MKYCENTQTYTNCTDNCAECIEELRQDGLSDLVERVYIEQKEYLDYVATLPPEEIIKEAYEICWRNEFVCLIENTDFDYETVKALLKLPHILETLYDEWLKTDVSVCQMLRDVINDEVKRRN